MVERIVGAQPGNRHLFTGARQTQTKKDTFFFLNRAATNLSARDAPALTPFLDMS